jgi:hypothetical protein
MNLTVALKEQPTKLNSSNESISFLTFLKNQVGTFFHQLGPRFFGIDTDQTVIPFDTRGTVTQLNGRRRTS